MLEAGETKPCAVCRIELQHDEKKKEFVEGGFPKLRAGEFGTDGLESGESVEPGTHGGASTDREARPLVGEPTDEMVEIGMQAMGYKAEGRSYGGARQRFIKGLHAALAVQRKGEG